MLASDKTESVAQFKDEIPQPLDQPVLQLPLLHLSPDTQKFQVVRALECLLRLLREIFRQDSREIVRLALRQRPLISPSLDLIEQDIAAPAKFRRGAEIVEARGGSLHFIKDLEMVAPWNFCDNLPQKFTRCCGGIRGPANFGCSLWPNSVDLSLRSLWQFGYNL